MKLFRGSVKSYIFAIFLLLGASCSLLCCKYLSGMWNSYLNGLRSVMEVIEQGNISFSELFPCVLFGRGREFLLLCCFNLTHLSRVYQGWYGWKTGFVFAMICTGCGTLYGVKGLAMGLLFYFPHGILLFYLIYLSIHCIEHYRRCRAGWKEWLKLIAAMSGLFLMMCLLESTVNPWILRLAI